MVCGSRACLYKCFCGNHRLPRNQLFPGWHRRQWDAYKYHRDGSGEKGQFGKAIDIEIDTKPLGKTNLTIEQMLAGRDVDLGKQEGSVVKMTDSTVFGGTTVILQFQKQHHSRALNSWQCGSDERHRLHVQRSNLHSDPKH